MGHYDQADPLFKRALAIYTNSLIPEHPEVARGSDNLAALYCRNGRHEEAAELEARAPRIRAAER